MRPHRLDYCACSGPSSTFSLTAASRVFFILDEVIFFPFRRLCISVIGDCRQLPSINDRPPCIILILPSIALRSGVRSCLIGAKQLCFHHALVVLKYNGTCASPKLQNPSISYSDFEVSTSSIITYGCGSGAENYIRNIANKA